MRTLAGAGISDARVIFNFQGEHAPLKRTPTLDEVGGAALYLLSDLSGAVTGEVHYVDCGYNVGRHADASRPSRRRSRRPPPPAGRARRRRSERGRVIWLSSTQASAIEPCRSLQPS